jgi:excisionase family DNA binding protein
MTIYIVEVEELDKYLTVVEISENLKIPASTVRDWLRKGSLKGVRIGRHWRIREIDLQEFTKRPEGEN